MNDSGFHVKDSWATRDVSINAETALRYGAFRKNGVVMTDDQHLRVVAALPVHMRTFVARNNLWGLAKYFGHDLRQKLGAALQQLWLI